jgi:prepilin signal peptidase PulO-like enzyme (type II secretory pathway)
MHLARIGRDDLSDHHNVRPQSPQGLKKWLGRRAVDQMKSAFAQCLRAGALRLEDKYLHLVAKCVRAAPPGQIEPRRFASVLYAYTPEIYPTCARATGAGCASAVGRLGALIGPHTVGIILPRVGQTGVFALGAGSFVLAAVAIAVLGIETKGKTLEVISR